MREYELRLDGKYTEHTFIVRSHDQINTGDIITFKSKKYRVQKEFNEDGIAFLNLIGTGVQRAGISK